MLRSIFDVIILFLTNIRSNFPEYRLTPTHPYCESLLKLSRFAYYLARQIHAAVLSKSTIVPSDSEDVKSLEGHIVSIKACAFASCTLIWSQ